MVAMVATSPAERIVELERELQMVYQECRMLRQEVNWLEDLFRLPARTVSASQQKTLYALHKETRGRDPESFFKVDTRHLSECVGQSPSTFLRNAGTLAENLGLFEKKTEDVWYSTGEDGAEKSKYTYLYVKPQPLLDHPRLYAPQEERNHGGARPGSGRKPTCRTCGSEHLATVTITRYRCLDCQDVWYEEGEEILLPSNNQLEKHTDDVVDSSLASDQEEDNQDDFVETPAANNQLEKQPGPIQVAPLLTTREDDQLETEDPVTLPLSMPAYRLNGFSFEDWLQKRIGHGEIIHATGSVDDKKRPKYLPIRVNRIDYDLAAYIRGDLQHIYGSRPALPDGTTYLFGSDCDTPELDGQHLAWMQQLAAAGIPSVYWKRRPGRGHLEVYVDHPVDRKAFYAHLVDVCPGLLAVPEVFPIGSDQNTGGVDRADFPYSWPLWYRNGNHVHECAAEVMFPGDQVPMISTGIESDRERLTWLISQVIIPAALIPERLVTQASRETTKRGGALLDIRQPKYSASSSDGLCKVIIAEFNDTHTWEEIAALCGGLYRDRFCSPAHKEDTPSVVIKGNYASDYGRTPSGRVETRDKFGWWCLAKGINQDEEIKRRIAERQEVHA